MSLLAALLAVLAIALALPAVPAIGSGRVVRPRLHAVALRPIVPVVVLAVAAVWLDLRGVVLLGVAVALVSGVGHLGRRRRAARRAEARAEQVLAACDAIASELAAGLPPSTALDRAAADWAELGPVAVAGRLGADVPEALRHVARKPGAGQLRRVAATWQVSLDSGAGLAAGLRGASAAIRADHRTARVVASELAAANATARMLGVLPLVILVLGAGVGGDPLHFLLGTTGGAIVLAVGVGLALGGVLWLQRIADGVLGR